MVDCIFDMPEKSNGNNVDSQSILLEQDCVEEVKRRSARRLLAYYAAMVAPEITSKLPERDKLELLSKIAGTLSEKELKDRIQQMTDAGKKKGIIQVLQELVEAYEDEALEKYCDIEVNGNTFSYTNDMDITPYMNLFEKIGQDMQGMRWRIEIDSEGKVVLHE